MIELWHHLEQSSLSRFFAIKLLKVGEQNNVVIESTPSDPKEEE